ncbi:alpha/beta fold hydrolase [Streptomyces halobius]|uniref:Alpha/beta fold hydrolase n=1 Tax=Streptomyces halobius TaxID=2879846 RepID=A0ABY4MA31_9ACTN|nr:alpha/beta hydrolase [Streptomyces halobius]UQA94624.1 alpha/beta fold hydrolase [Streptomyces halobius]
MRQFVEAAPGVRLRTEQHGPADAPPLLLIMGAQASGLGWPEPLIEALATRHRVIRYDHRDTGRSTWSLSPTLRTGGAPDQPYRLADLADDVIAALDGLGIGRAHLGMSMGGMLAQMALADHPDRLISASLIGTSALSTTPYTLPGGARLPADELSWISPEVLEPWSRPVEDHGLEAEPDRRVAHWRVLAGGQLPFDADYFRSLERRIIEHTGHYRTSTAHSRAGHDGMLRTDQLARNEIPTLVIAVPADPVIPPPYPQHLAQVINGARLVEIPGMGHALPPAVHAPLADAIRAHTGTAHTETA